MKTLGNPIVGQLAPDFTLTSSSGGAFTLSEHRDRHTILAFYPADWSPVCGDQMTLYNEVLPLFADLGGTLVGISVDGVWSHKAFAEARNLDFALLADFEPKGQVARLYGVYRGDEGTSERALFVIDTRGILRWSYLSPVGINPGADGILSALEEINQEDG
jgi:peroxiredoxin